MNVLVRDIASSRPVKSLGYDPSTEKGARMLAYRIRLRWLEQGWDVPCIVGLSISVDEGGNKAFRDMFGPKLLIKLARKVSAEEAVELRRQIENEIAAWLVAA